MTSQCLWSNNWSNHRTLKDQYLIARIKVAIAQIIFAIALMILATLVILISIRVFIISLMNSVSDVQEFKFLDFYTALILGGWLAFFTSIKAMPSDGALNTLARQHRVYSRRFNTHPSAALLSATSGISSPTIHCNTDDSEVAL